MSGRGGHSHGPCGLAGPKAQKAISLALQGGGAHGAFTWGVLDRLIEDGRLAFEAISGASAGAMNAVVMASGWAVGGPDKARETLENFWKHVSLDGNLSTQQRQVFDMLLNIWAPSAGNPILDFWRDALSPSQSNPLDLNPLRDVVKENVDFDRLRKSDVKIFISATNVKTGKIKIFDTAELKAEHVLASACLPTVFRSVEIDDEYYWDGGYTGNPALFPLFYKVATDDIMIVQINPIERAKVPTDMLQIQNRLSEITFNGGLLSELRAVDFVNRMIDQGKLTSESYKRALVHRIEGGEGTARFEASTRLKAEWDFFLELRDIGRASASEWLKAHYADIGKRSTLDLRTAYS